MIDYRGAADHGLIFCFETSTSHKFAHAYREMTDEQLISVFCFSESRHGSARILKQTIQDHVAKSCAINGLLPVILM